MNEYHDIDLMRMQLIKNAQTKEEFLEILLYEYIPRAIAYNEEYAKVICDKIYELLNMNTLNTSSNDNFFPNTYLYKINKGIKLKLNYPQLVYLLSILLNINEINLTRIDKYVYYELIFKLNKYAHIKYPGLKKIRLSYAEATFIQQYLRYDESLSIPEQNTLLYIQLKLQKLII